MSDPFVHNSEPGAAEIGAAEPGQTAAAAITSITPDTGALGLQGQAAHTRPFSVPSGNVALTGQSPIVKTSIIPQTGALSTTGQPASNATLSTIVSAEYTGDGNNPRAFESLGTTPLVVFVFGKDGSGNLVGAIKTGTMPSGKSQPLETAQASGATTRSNRILDLTANGFTVGSNLNVTGRKYAYIIFPAGRQTSVTTRAFVAPGGKPAVNSTLNVSAVGGGATISGTNCFTATGDEVSGWARPIGSTFYSSGVTLITAGRRAIRNSDGVVLCEVTASIDANSATGIGYVSGNTGGNAWHWEEYYVDLFGQICDMILLMADDTGGTTPSVPLTVIKPTEMAATNGDWAGNGFGELDVFLASDTDTALHISPRASGGAPALTKGVTYHIVTFHDDEANTHLKLHTFTWTGTGPLGTPPTLAGMDFKPDWAFVYNSNNSFTWSKNSSNILGTNLHDRGWIDTGGDSSQAALVSWDSGGVTLTAGGDWNSNGAKYLGIFFIADAVNTAIRPDAGALALTGQQPTVAKKTSITPNTGELHLTGKQPTLTPSTTRITPQTGSLILTPRNPIRAQKRTITPGTGSLRVTGKAAKTKESKGHKVTTGTAEDPPTGGLQISGKQPVLKISIVPGTGALTATGQKPFVRPPDFPIYTQTGALNLQGQIPRVTITITPGTGHLVADGRAAILHQSFPVRITVDTGELGMVGQRPPIGTSLIPNTGTLEISGIDTEPIVQSNNTYITPLTGDLSISGVSPATNPGVVVDFRVTPFTGDLNLQGQEPIVQTGQNVTITPGTGALNFVGQRVIVSTPSPTPPGPPPTGLVGGGVGLPHPRRLPFWPKPVAVVRGSITEPAASFKGRLRAEENELELLLDL